MPCTVTCDELQSISQYVVLHLLPWIASYIEAIGRRLADSEMLSLIIMTMTEMPSRLKNSSFCSNCESYSDERMCVVNFVGRPY